MMKVCVLFLLAALPALCQFGDARSLQHQPIKPGMTCASDAYVLTWVSAHGQFECLAVSGSPTGAAGGVLGGTYPSPTFAGGASFNANAATFLNGAGSFTSPGTANARITFSNVASATMTLTGVAVKAVVTCWDSSVSPARLFIPDSVEQTDADTLTFNFSPNATGYCDGSTGIGLTGATGPTGPAGGVTSVFGSTGVITTLADPTFTGTMTVGTSLSVDGTTGIAATSKLANVALNTITAPLMLTAGVPSAASAANIVSLFSTCSGTQYLGADGACHSATAGTVTTVGFTGGLVSVANPTTTPAFTVAGTSGGLPYFASASTWASSAAGTAGHLVLWGGAGSAPTDGGLPTSGTVTSIATTGPITGGTITTTGTIACATCVTSSAPGAGIAHFAGSTQAVTSSAVSLTADVSGVLPTANIAVALANQTSLRGNAIAAAAGDATIAQVIAHGATALATGAISSATCATVVTATATGTLTTDAFEVSFNGDPTAVTGYVPLTAGMLTIIVYPTADTFNAKVCNNTSSSITPGAITLNWKVIR